MLREDNLLKQISIVQNMIVANVVTLIKVLLEVKWKSVCDYQQTVYHWSEVEKNLCFEWVYGAKHKNIFKSFASLKCFSSYATYMHVLEIIWHKLLFNPNAGKYGPEKLPIRTLFK